MLRHKYLRGGWKIVILLTRTKIGVFVWWKCSYSLVPGSLSCQRVLRLGGRRWHCSSAQIMPKRDQLEGLHGPSWDRGARGVWQWWIIHHNLANVTGEINQRWAKLQKEMYVNSFVSVFVGLVQKAVNDFLNKFTSTTLNATLWWGVRKCSPNKKSKTYLAQRLFFNILSLDFLKFGNYLVI